jgi:GGDEF domain-containing protein
MIVIDNANNYAHGKLYLIYIIIYFVIVALVIVEFALHGRKFRRHNRASLFGILIFLVTGITFQIFTDVRCAYIALTLALALLFIHHSEFSQQEADYKIQEQKILITIDPLTGILNRYAYEKDLSSLVDKEDLVIFSIDINNLKVVNDTKGHAAGDELICGAAKLISDTFNKYGKHTFIGEVEEVAEYMHDLDGVWISVLPIQEFHSDETAKRMIRDKIRCMVPLKDISDNVDLTGGA